MIIFVSKQQTIQIHYSNLQSITARIQLNVNDAIISEIKFSKRKFNILI